MMKKTKAGSYDAVITPDMLEKVKEWKKKGLSDRQIAKSLGVSSPTLYNWRRKHEEFGEIWKWVKREEITLPDLPDIPDSAIGVVEDALLKRCLGMTVTETSISPDGKKWVKTKELPPDPNACYQWLKVHSPKWRQAVQITVTGATDDVEDNPLLGMTKKDLEKLVKMAGEPVA